MGLGAIGHVYLANKTFSYGLGEDGPIGAPLN